MKNKNIKKQVIKGFTVLALGLTSPFAFAVNPALTGSPYYYKTESYNDLERELNQRLDKLENRIDSFKAEVSDGPNTKRDDTALSAIDKLKERADKIEEKIDKVGETKEPKKFENYVDTDVSLIMLEYDYLKLAKKYKYLR